MMLLLSLFALGALSTGTDDVCAELGKGACKKSPMCKLVKKGGCVMALEPECYGNRVDIHDKCVKDRNGDFITKQGVCETQTSGLGTRICKWGYNTFDLDSKVMKCMKDNKVTMGATCTSNSDCKCGNRCVLFGEMGGCSTCRDEGTEYGCNLMKADYGMSCKWIGGENGVCIQVDPCRDFSLDEGACNAKKMCEFKDSKCAMVMVSKKSCKKLGKGDNKNDTEDIIKKRGEECLALTGCQWSEKKKKCKMGKN